jgi:DNA topoisomerase-2
MTKREVTEKYQSMTDIEHVLNRPDSYIGNINTLKVNTDILVDNKIITKSIKKNSGFHKIFDEVITNCIDESKENKKLNKIDVTVTKEYIEIIDNGGIPVVKSDEFDNKYLPEFLFGQLRTSSNYNDEEERDVAGTNGVGAKATCIFSKRFLVETADGKNKFTQEFKENLSKRTRAKVIPNKRNYTKIKYYPDLDRFGMTEIDDTHINLFRKRVFDLAALNKNIKFTFNKEKINFKNFKDYCLLYGLEEESLFTANSDTWTIGISYSDNGFKQISFVNSIFTFEGGTHVEYIFNQIVDFLRPYILKKHKLDIKPYEIRNNLFLFVNSTIINNKFSSQTKEKLTTDPRKFGTEFEIPKSILNKIAKSEIVQRILDWKQTKIEIAEKVELRKLNKKVERLKLPNLIDCSSKNREDCSLGIYEGFCLEKNTQIKVLSNTGELLDRALKDVTLDDYVISHTGSLERILNISNIIKKKTVIKTQKGDLVCSLDHKWYVFNLETESFEFVKTKN